MTLMLGMNRERTHPGFGSRKVSDIESDNAATIVTPQHCTCSRIGNCESPHRWLEMWNAPPSHSVAAIPLGQRFAENFVQLANVGLMNLMRSARCTLRSPRTCDCHQVAPAVSSSRAASLSPECALPPP